LNRWLLPVLVALGVLAMMTNASLRRRTIMRKVAERVEGFDRFVDVGVEMRVVRADPRGTVELPGGRMGVVLRTHRWGGLLDTHATPPQIVGPSRKSRRWFCSEDQEPIVLHPDSLPMGLLFQGSMGSGKTTALAMWHHRRWVDHIGEIDPNGNRVRREGGQTAPTLQRLGLVKAEMLKLYAPNWGRYVQRDDFTGFEMCDGNGIRFVSTHRQSASAGSPVQGFNWSWCGRDEMQDQVLEHEHIEARGRAARDGGTYYKQLGTATAKDDPEWRTLRDRLREAKGDKKQSLWDIRFVYGRNSPFVSPSYWASLAATMSPREYAKNVENKDLGPERATYPTWSRETNLITVPDLGWTNVTAHELRGIGPNYTMLVGHDPGELWDVSLFLRAFVETRDEADYYRGKKKPFWVVLGEFNTEQSTTEAHIKGLLETVRERWQLNLLSRTGKVSSETNQILVRADPAGNTDTKTDKSVYTQFVNAGIKIKPAAYNADNTGHGRVPREEGVELITSLFCNAAGERRLFVARNADGSPAAKMFVRAIEQSERDLAGKAENHAKGKGDQTHWPAAGRYALWAIERPRLQLRARES
jgi:hypothetical protein